ncbi:uncharacterized protein [Amphiura filiformis]|uniref:uncharacterized protein n=1 Tax=Amphiura filiformis TaxID=82378 RepID=UPI003B21BD75
MSANNGPATVINAHHRRANDCYRRNLVPYSSYTVTVYGTDVSGGVSGQTTSVSTTFQTAQGTPAVSPVGLRLLTVSQNRVTFMWDPLTCGNRRGVVRYRYEIKQGSTIFIAREVNAVSANEGGLSPGTTYFITVAALTEAGDTGPSSTALSVTTDSAPGGGFQNPTTGAICRRCGRNRRIRLRILLARIAINIPAVFTPALNNPSSPQYQVLVVRVSIVFQIYCNRFVGCIGVVIIRFFPGSIGVDMDYIFEEDSPVTGAMVMETVLDTASENDDGVGDGLFITPAATTVNDLCPPNYCSNGGTCISDSEANDGFCLCPDGFGGTTCTDIVPGGVDPGPGIRDDSRTLAITIAMTTIGIVLIAVLIATGFVIYIRILRPRMLAKRQMQFNGTPHPTDILGEDPLLVDPVTLASPWSFRQSLMGGEAFVGQRV